MADAVNRGSEFLTNMTAGTPWEAMAKEVTNTLGVDSPILGTENTTKNLEFLVDVITSWMANNSSPKLLKPI